MLSFLINTRKKNWILSFGIDDGKLLQCIATVRHTSKYCKPFSVQNNQQQLFLIRKAKILTYFWINLFFSYFLQNLSFFFFQIWDVWNFFIVCFTKHYKVVMKKKLKKFSFRDLKFFLWKNQLFFYFIYFFEYNMNILISRVL